MRTINLTKGYIALVDDSVFDELNKFKWCVSAGNKYAIRREGPRPGVVIYMHHQIIGFRTVVDHIDNNTLNNQRDNLRVADKAKNSMNRPRQSNNTTGFKGVSICKGKYQAYIKKDGKKINLGTYTNPEEAAYAYDHAAIKLFGSFAQTNFAVNQPSPYVGSI